MAKAHGALLNEEAPAGNAAEARETVLFAREAQPQAGEPLGHPFVGGGTGAGVPELRVVTIGTTTIGMMARMPMVIAAPLLMW